MLPLMPAPAPTIGGALTPAPAVQPMPPIAAMPAGQPPPAAMGPPQNPAVEQNKGLWRGFFDRLKTDPNFRTAVMQTGAGLMRTPQMGQSGFDVAGQALMNGATTLDILRQRDRMQTIEEQERTRKAGLEERGVTAEERQVGAQERTAAATESRAATDAQATADRAKEAQAQAQHAVRALDEAIRHNKATEQVDRLRAEADRKKSEAYLAGRAGRDPKDVVFMNALSEKYQASGIDEVTADAMAVEYLKETKAGKAPADRIRAALDTRIKAYNGSMAALDTPLDNNMMKQWMNEEIAREKELESVVNPSAGAAVGPQAGGGGSTQTPFSAPGPAGRPSSADFLAQPVTPGGAPPAGSVLPQAQLDPKIVAWIHQQTRAGTPPEQIRQTLIQYGKNPADYGQ